MSSDKTTRQGAALVGVGAAACVACCAGPIVAFIAAASIATVVGATVFGIGGLSIAVVAVLAYLRHHNATGKKVALEPVSVTLGTKPDA